ncbi:MULTISPECIES: hypothetical protein [Phenylobacterium]|uniref:Uncharacterized protein n=1 Tax=Phenylobacterium koreense TaxID=266125 RepID=A0ABV2EG20_9CAUL
MAATKPSKPAEEHPQAPTTPAEESSRRAPDHIVSPAEKAKVAEEASREEDA